MAVTVLWRLAGEPAPVNGQPTPDDVQFGDVVDGIWYTDAVTWAAANGIVSGYGGGRFGPEDYITREQLAVIFLNYFKHIGEGPVGAWMVRVEFEDLAEISDWAFEAVAYCSIKGLITGKPGIVFDPRAGATRAEFATMLMRLAE